MLPLRHLRFWRIAGVVLLCLVLASALMPVVWFWDNRASGLALFRNIDKLLHATTFLLLAVWFSGQYRRPSYLRVAVGLMMFGLFIEGCQYLVGYRQADLLDMAANTAGIVAGFGIAIAGLGGWSQRLEDWYRARNAGRDLG
ncbi:MAG: VanZ family protein [Woeseiaceae bacterium]